MSWIWNEKEEPSMIIEFLNYQLVVVRNTGYLSKIERMYKWPRICSRT